MSSVPSKSVNTRYLFFIAVGYKTIICHGRLVSDHFLAVFIEINAVENAMESLMTFSTLEQPLEQLLYGLITWVYYNLDWGQYRIQIKGNQIKTQASMIAAP